MSALQAQFLPVAADHDRFLETLYSAHGEIEKRFLESGAVLMNTMDILNSLVGLLDTVTGAMDKDVTRQMVENLQQPVRALAVLPARQEDRLQKFSELQQLSTQTVDKISDMHLIIRYMQTFAVTAKITSAGISDFATFAEEIRERIRSGASEVGNLDNQVVKMRTELEKALKFTVAINTAFDATIPQIVSNLTTKSEAVSAQHDKMLAIATEVRQVAGSFQKKIGSVLSGIQIGDITRQRIEHVGDMLQGCDAFIREQADGELDAQLAKALKSKITEIAHAQLSATVSEFLTGCNDVTRSISSFKTEAARILELRDRLVQNSRDGDRGILQTMKDDILQAIDLVGRVQANSADAGAIVDSVTASSEQLVHGVDMLRGIQSDIHYMSLNTNLRSSKLGDSGKSVKVVSDELRKYSEDLDIAAENIVVDFEKLKLIADALASQSDAEISDLADPLNLAVEMLNQLDANMKSGLQAFSAESLSATDRLEQEISKLDFKSRLGDTLSACLALSKGMAGQPAMISEKLKSIARPLNQQIYSSYTMRQERDIHQKLFPLDQKETASDQKPVQQGSESDEDLFAEALF